MADGYAVRARFEQAFAAEMQQKYAVAVHSGTIGLFLALRACGVGPGDEVITVGNSDISTTAAISQCGATPVLCDILDTDFTIDPSLVERLITPRTRAILPVDLYGHPADVAALRPIADAHGLKIVEDAALATGAYDYGKPLGTFADVTIFSFAPLKPLGSVSNGAAVTTNNDAIYEQLHILSHYGAPSSLPGGNPAHQHYVGEGYNVPLDALQAALLLVKLPHLRDWTEKRRLLVNRYDQRLADLPVQQPRFRAESRPSIRAYTILVGKRDQLFRQLREAGIEAVIHYNPLAYRQPVYNGRLPGSDNLPVTDAVGAQVIGLPVAPDLTFEDVDFTVDALTRLL
jgi:dTDP-4-amino-4,6-dideoxygalactose transaminase